MHPSLPLGVPLMDADHAALEAMFARVETLADGELADHFAAIEAEVIAHFAREEVLMEEVGVPVLHCHRHQHRLLLDVVAALRPSPSTTAAVLRRTFAELARQVEAHVDSVDRVTSQFLAAPAPASLPAHVAAGTCATGA